MKERKKLIAVESGPKENIGRKLIKQGVSIVYQKTDYRCIVLESF